MKLKTVNMNIWKPVQIDNVGVNCLEGLIGIEECTNYDSNVFKSKKVTKIASRCENRKVIKKTKKNAKLLRKQIKHKVSKELLSPSKQGFTEDKYNESVQDFPNHNPDFESNLNLENVKSWTNLPLQECLLKALVCLNFAEPTRIQSLTLPAAILGKRDILGAAETGSGKTLAFGLPMLYGILKLKENLKSSNSEGSESRAQFDKTRIIKKNFNSEGIGLVRSIDNIDMPKNSIPNKPLYGLILTPTRELAIQIKNHLTVLAQFTDIFIAVIVGGMAVEKQTRILAKGPDIVVATPGRLWELIEEGNSHLLQINTIKYLAIDETDRMTEKGHFKELNDILERINVDNRRRERQNFVFSATLTMVHELPKYLVTKRKMRMNSRISDMTPAQKLQKIVEMLNIENPKVVDITQGTGTSQTLTECRITCSINEKDYYVYYFLKKHPGRTLIFCNTIGCVRRLVTLLSLLNCNPLALHSSLQQRQRLKNLDRFKENKYGLLIATDVAARGLDISCIQHVMHYQTPRTTESYVHRSGRTARASEEGITVLLVEPGELQQYLRLCRTLGKTEDMPLFPIQEDMLNAVKERVNLARELDKLELKVRKTNSEAGWLQKAAEEMDILLDDDLCKYDRSESQQCKKAVNIRRKELSALLQMPLFQRNFNMKYPLSQANISFLTSNKEEDNAIEIMKNAIKTNNAKCLIKTKHLFKSKIRRNGDNINLNTYLKKNSNLKQNIKNNKKRRTSRTVNK